MNKKALFYGLIYSITFIAIKLTVLLGGYSLNKFGYYFSNISCVLLIIPFYFIALKHIRDRDYKGVISGKDSIKLLLTIFGLSAIITGVYNYIEFECFGKKLAVDYYKSEQFLIYLKSQSKIKVEDYVKIIAEQINNASSFKSTTGKLFSAILISTSSAFIVASIMKRNAK